MQGQQAALRQLLQSGLQPVQHPVASLGPALAGRGAKRPAGSEKRRLDAEDGMADQPTLSARLPGTGASRTAPTGESGLAECAGLATHCGSWLVARHRKGVALDRALADRRGGMKNRCASLNR